MEKELHLKLKNIVSKHLKNKGFSVKQEAKLKKLIIDLKARKSNSTILFECEIPPNYKKYLSYKHNVEAELLKLAFVPSSFVKKCIRKVSNVFNKIDALPILVIPNDFFFSISETKVFKNRYTSVVCRYRNF